MFMRCQSDSQRKDVAMAFARADSMGMRFQRCAPTRTRSQSDQSDRHGVRRGADGRGLRRRLGEVDRLRRAAATRASATEQASRLLEV